MKPIKVILWNFERNGASDRQRRLRGHELLVSIGPDLVLRQEMWGADANGNETLYELESVLGLRGWLGPASCTAVFADPRRFTPVREWPATGPIQVQPPTVLTFRYTPAGRDAMPLIVGSYHLNYASASLRQTEAEWLSTWADKRHELPDGTTVRLPALLGGDNNSYPVPADGDLSLPELEAIPDRPHRLHRSVPSPDKARAMDTRPDEALRLAGLEDVARHWATARDGSPEALARTVTACDTHGPDARIDRIYTTTDLLPAVAGLDVIEVEPDMSDHHIVRLSLDPDVLSDILNRQVARLNPTGSAR